MRTPVQTINYRNYSIEIHYDECPESPREWDNLGTIYSNWSKLDPDKHHIDELIEEVGGNIYDNVIPWDLIGRKYYYLKIWAYDHSGITLRTGDTNPFGTGWMGWDSGLMGVIVVDKKKAEKEYGKGDVEERALKCLEGEVADLDKWVSGEIYGFIIKDEYDEEIDACWGFYDEEEAINEAKAIVDCEWDNHEDVVNEEARTPETTDYKVTLQIWNAKSKEEAEAAVNEMLDAYDRNNFGDIQINWMATDPDLHEL